MRSFARAQAWEPPAPGGEELPPPPEDWGQRFCPNCGNAISEDFMFCRKCGRKLRS